jgi:serine/threonine protein kinase
LESSVHKEILVLSTFRHPNIIKLLAYSWKLPRMYLVFELAGGGSLERYLKEDSLAQKLSWANRVAIARGVVSALQYMHSGDHGKRAVAFHRDLKAANVVLSAFSAGETPTPKLIDCGLAKFIPTRDSKATVLTSGVGKVWGTSGYVCPHYQRCPDEGYSSQNEVFSLGVLLAELFTGSLQNQSHTHHSKIRMSDAKLSPPDRRAGALSGPVGTFALVCTYATPVRRRVFLQPLESNDNSSYRSGSARVGGPLPENGT